MMVAGTGATIATGMGDQGTVEAMADSRDREMVVEGSSDLLLVIKEGTRRQPCVRIRAKHSSRR
jgi:hypothetical protein